MEEYIILEKRCIICGKFFQLSRFTSPSRQKMCSNPECKRIRNRLNSKKWRREHPDYYKTGKGTEWRVKEKQRKRKWQKENPEYIKKWREEHYERWKKYMRKYMKKRRGQRARIA